MWLKKVLKRIANKPKTNKSATDGQVNTLRHKPRLSRLDRYLFWIEYRKRIRQARMYLNSRKQKSLEKSDSG